MRVAFLNDTHCGIRNSSEIFIDYQERFYEEIFFPYLIENNIKRIIHLGDAFDNRKFINFKALHRYRKHFLAKLRTHGIHMDIIPGNHDVFYKNTNDLNALKELLGHYMGEVTIHMDPTVLNLDGFNLALLPWICAENEKKSIEFVKTCNADWLAGHLELEGFEVMKGFPSPHGMDHKLFSRFEKVLSGHYHTRSEKANVLYFGSQMEFFSNDAHDPKHFHILDTETREITAIRNPITLFERINYDDRVTDYNQLNLDHLDNKFVKLVVIHKKDLFTFDRFVDRIQEKKIHELKIAENFSEFMGEQIEDNNINVEDTHELLDSYVDAVDTDLDKERIKSEMRNLLIEAQTLEVA